MSSRLRIGSRSRLWRWTARYTVSFVLRVLADPFNRAGDYRGLALFRLYAREILGFPAYAAITARPLSSGSEPEGAGSQILRRICAIDFARHNGLTYLHTPLEAAGHADRPAAEWAAAWERTFNLGAGELAATPELERQRGPVANFILLYGWALLPLYDAARPWGVSRALVREVREKYYLTKRPRENARFTVGVHVRRGDVDAASYPEMWTDVAVIAATLDTVRSVLAEMGIAYAVHIHSQGPAGELASLEGDDVTLHLDEDALSTFDDLVGADLLVMAKSSFSYLAAIVGEGIKITQEFYEPLDDWIPCDPTGAFDRQLLIDQLRGRPTGRGPTGKS
jgi:hypothetical protein